MIQNAILEAAAGVPAVLHGGGPCPGANRTITRPGPLGGPVEFLIATYLIVADAGTTLSISDDCTYLSELHCAPAFASDRPLTQSHTINRVR